MIKITNTYVEYLKGNFFKCLCMFENKEDNLTTFIDSIIYEVYGLQYVIEGKEDLLLTLLARLKHFYEDSQTDNPDIKRIRREVFNSMTLIDKSLKVGD